MKLVCTAFPDFSERPVRIIVGDDVVAAEVLITGTHLGECTAADGAVIAPSGKKLAFKTALFTEFRDRKVVHETEYHDLSVIADQVGSIWSLLGLTLGDE
jgi:predicted ester cyclase